MHARYLSQLLLAALFLLLDYYTWQAVELLGESLGREGRMLLGTFYWVLSGMALLTFMGFMQFRTKMLLKPGSLALHVFAIVVGLYLAKVLSSLFLLGDDARRLLIWNWQHWVTHEPSSGLSRSVTLSWLGLGSGSLLYVIMLAGFANKYRYKIHRLTLHFHNLPAAFRGLKIVQLSDIHSGSLANKEAVEEGIALVMREQPDLILFTGDLVNDRASEMEHYVSLFARLKAPLGVYSVLGNHDYGDYVAWESKEHKRKNLEALKQVHADMGWRLLLNEHVSLSKEGEEIALLGVENWGAKGFAQYGDLAKTYSGTEKYPFKILMSHDPSHWEAQVLKNYPDIDLTLSGHTHGMQFGFETSWFRFSPVQWIYRHWAGLYEKGLQKLYVNRGFGFIGYQGRVGILPEISVLELN